MITYNTHYKMEDTQGQKDSREIPLDWVGISHIKLPITFKDQGQLQHTFGIINFFAHLAQRAKGHHMSRFVEILEKHKSKNFNHETLLKIARETQKTLNTKNVFIEAKFTYFLTKKSPVSKKISTLDYECKISILKIGKTVVKKILVSAPVLLLCPCSKAISKYNAHNQRASATVNLTMINTITIKNLIALIEEEASYGIFPLLKRTDEKMVTEKSYETPKFVEDIVRDIALKLKKIKKIESFSVECESLESIHNHNAYAKYSNTKIDNVGI